jgi:hypothetical protein
MVAQSQNSPPTFPSQTDGGGSGISQGSLSQFNPIPSGPPSTQPDGYDGSTSAAATPSGESGAKRKKVNHGMYRKFLRSENCPLMLFSACLYCRRSHMTCDSNRPCGRCVKRNIGHLCHDEIRDKSRENGSESTDQSPAVGSTSPELGHVDAEIKTGAPTLETH